MGTRIGYRIEARARMKGRYGTGWHLTSLIKTIGGEFSDRQRNPNHNYAYTRLQQILSQDSSRTSVNFVPCTGLWRRLGTESRIVWLPYPYSSTHEFRTSGRMVYLSTYANSLYFALEFLSTPNPLFYTSDLLARGFSAAVWTGGQNFSRGGCCV